MLIFDLNVIIYATSSIDVASTEWLMLFLYILSPSF